MSRIDLDFHRATQSAPRFGVLMLVLGIVIAAITADSIFVLTRRAADLAVIEREIAPLEERMKVRSADIETPEQARLRERVSAQDRRAAGMLATIEAAWDKNLSMNQLSYAKEADVLIIDFEAKDLSEAMAFQKRLVDSGVFSQVRLLRHSVKTSGAVRTTQVAIELRLGTAI